MTVLGLMGEQAPKIRPSDLLTEDHPVRPYPSLTPVRNSAWVRAGIFILVFIVGAILYFSINLAITTSPFISDVTVEMMELIGAVLAYLVLVMLTERRVWPHELAPRRILGLFKGMLLGFLLVSVCIGVLALIGTYRITAFNPSYVPWSDLLGMGVVAGIAEEIMFRGIVFRLVEEGLGTWGAVIVSGFVFGIMHWSNPDGTLWGGIAIAIEAGILFAAVYTVTRSLWWTIGLHFAWNITEGPIFGSIVSGNGAQNSWLTSTWSGPQILSGGQFGLEGSIVPVILLGALGVFLLVHAQRKGLMVAPLWIRKRALTRAPAGPTPGPAK
ncbi:MAG: CPBP family intramembrane metalloprotease [Propionibacteriaceae bacterium]|nr:CPBP family intramembrane metalloprotease [Propionibacteriaceae bacterium]